MGKGYEQHQARQIALQALGKDLARRAKSKCELTGEAGVPLRPYELPPIPQLPDLERTLLLSERCHEVLDRPEKLKGRSWQCLTEMIWSELPATQTLAWRMLQRLSITEDWAREALENAILDPETEEWAKSSPL